MAARDAAEPAANPRRRFIRHTADVPIEVRTVPGAPHSRRPALNVSVGGLSFIAEGELPIGSTIEIRIGDVDPPFEARARVVWARREADGCRVGVQFLDASDAFRARMVEQVCAIESYRRQVAAEEGRVLSREEAAREWIGKYGAKFPAS